LISQPKRRLDMEESSIEKTAFLPAGSVC
jgi:hypothetical protein